MVDTLGIFAIYDKKSEKFDTPFFAFSELFAKRRFLLMMDEDGPLKKWPEDFELKKVGEFNTNTGDVIEDQKLVIEAKSVVKGVKKNG